MERKSFIGCPAVRALTVAVASAGVIAVSGTCALAQMPGFYESDNPDVTVDMSVLEGSGSGANVRALPPAPGVSGRLLVPGPQRPVSRLYVKPTGSTPQKPAPSKERLALTPPSKGPGLPPVEPPASTMNVPAKAVPPAQPSATKPAAPKRMAVTPPASATETKPSTPKRLVAAPPAPKVAAPAPMKPSIAAAAPPPPAIEKPRTASAAPSAPTAPVAPSVEKPQIAKAPQTPVTAVPAPPPAPPAGTEPTTAAAEPTGKEHASLPKAEGPVQPGKSLKLVFDAGGSKLTDQARTELKNLLQGLLDKSELRLQLLAYAGGESLSSSKARRLSLSRALAVRSYLIESGLRSTRIDVRALGNKATEEPINRVDVNVVER